MPINLDSDLRKLIFSTLPLGPRGAAQIDELHSLSTIDLMLVFLNWENRLIHPHRRRVHRSALMQTRIANLDDPRSATALLGKIAAGCKLDASLSNKVAIGWEPGGKRSVWDFDLMLNEWGIHHLHLRASGGDDVLAVIFRPGDAYALDLIQHGEWAAKRLVETAVRSFPDAKLFLKLPGIMLQTEPTEGQRKRLRGAGVMSPLLVDDAVYVPPTGFSSARTTAIASRAAHRVVSQLHQIESDPKVLISNFRRAAAGEGRSLPPRPDYAVCRVSNPTCYGIGIVERISGLCVGLG